MNNWNSFEQVAKDHGWTEEGIGFLHHDDFPEIFLDFNGGDDDCFFVCKPDCSEVYDVVFDYNDLERKYHRKNIKPARKEPKQLPDEVIREVLLTEAAEKVVKTLVDRYGYYSDSRPVVSIETDKWGGMYAQVMWECGPPQWATGDTYWLHEEVASMMAEFGADTAYDADKYRPYWDAEWGTFYEAQNSFTLHIRVALYC